MGKGIKFIPLGFDYAFFNGTVKCWGKEFALFSFAPADVRIIGISLAMTLHVMLLSFFAEHRDVTIVQSAHITSDANEMVSVMLNVQSRKAKLTEDVSKSKRAEKKTVKDVFKADPEPLLAVDRVSNGGDTLREPDVGSVNGGEHYYVFSELDAAAVPEIEIFLQPLIGESNLGMTVIAVVDVYIDKAGNVQDVIVESVDPPEYKDSLVEALKFTSFVPATRGGSAVNSIKVMEIRVSL